MINLTEIPQLARNLGRLVEIGRTLVKYGLADGLARLDYRFVRRIARGTEIARLSAFTPEARIRLVLTELGTTFIKFGQVLSTRRDIIGPALGDELAQLQAHVPGDPYPVTRATIEEELGRPLVEVFPEFEHEPLASASIGQVHLATLHDGRKVVVKVQHPGIARRVANDVAILSELASLAEQFLPDLRPYRPVALVAEFQRVLTRELDFRRELRHLQMFRAQFAADPCVRFPEPYPAFSTGRVLTMEYLDGVPFTGIEKVTAAGGDPDELARRGARIFLEMIFRDGLFHADPHPGNVLFLPPTEACPNGAIGLLDVGMVGRLDARLRERIERAVTAVMRRDATSVTEIVMQVGDVPAKLDPQALEAEIAEQLAYYWGMPLEQFQLGTALNDLTEAIRKYQVMLPPPLALLLRVLVMLEGTGRLLSPKFNLVELLEPYRRKLVLKRLSPKRVWRRTLLALQDWDDLVRSLPRQLGVLLRMLQKQEIGVQLLHKHLKPSVNRLVFGMMVSALFVGSAQLWAYKAPPLYHDISIFGVFGCAVACFLGFHLFRAIQHSGKLEERE
jgi:ubiquinone biosynthesis protein